MYPYVKHLSPQKQCPQCSSHDVWYLSIWTLLDLMEHAVLAGGAMTTHVVNAIYLGSLWILIKFLRWRSNHCRGGWIVPEWRRWYNTHVRHKEPDCTKGGWYDTSSKPHRRPLPRAIRFDRFDNDSILIGDLTFLVYCAKNIQDWLWLMSTHHIPVTWSAALLLLFPQVADDVVQVLADQVATKLNVVHVVQLPSSQLPHQLLHVRQPTQSPVRSLGIVKLLKIGGGFPGKDCHY